MSRIAAPKRQSRLPFGGGGASSGGGSSSGAKRPRSRSQGSEGRSKIMHKNFKPAGSESSAKLLPVDKEVFEAMVIQPNENNEFLGCLSAQAKDLKSAQKRLDIPAWVAVTPKGLACWECRSADEQKIYVYGANSQAFRTEASTNGRPLEAIRMHGHGSGMSESVVRQIEIGGGTIPKPAHQQRAEELRNREIQAKAFINGHRVSLSKAEEAIHARLDSVLFLAENKVPMSQLKAQVELLNRRGALGRGPLPGQDGSFGSLTASYTSVDIADQLVYALAAAIDLWYQPLIKMQKAIGVASDGTSRAKKPHQAIVYKILNLSVPNRKPPPHEYRGCALQLYASVLPKQACPKRMSVPQAHAKTDTGNPHETRPANLPPHSQSPTSRSAHVPAFEYLCARL